jgi:dTDP-4-dehydrorhamnose reductase
MSRKIVWIIGARGLIGNYLMRTAPNWEVRPIMRDRIDLLDFSKVRELWKDEPPDVVIHCAAISRAVVCEQNPELARKVNVELTSFLSELAADKSFIFFSSDLVFDGKKGNYSESDTVSPLTVYGKTKIEAEAIILQNPKHTSVRTSLNAGVSPAGNRSFTEETRLAWAAGKTLSLFTDEFRSPIPALVTAQAVWKLVEARATGLFHLAGAERLSRLQIGELLARRWPNIEARIKSASLRDYQGPPRSADTSLNCDKIQKLLPFPLPRFSEWLTENPNEPI